MAKRGEKSKRPEESLGGGSNLGEGEVDGERPVSPSGELDWVDLLEEVDLLAFLPGVENLTRRLTAARGELARDLAGQPLKLVNLRRLGHRANLKKTLRRVATLSEDPSQPRKTIQATRKLLAQACRHAFWETALSSLLRARVANREDDVTQRVTLYREFLETVVEMRTLYEVHGEDYPQLFSDEAPLKVLVDEEVEEASPPTTVTHVRYEERDKLPTFAGDFRDWDGFWQQFLALVDRRPSISPIQKLTKLLAALEGEAKEQVRTFKFMEASYEPIKTHLEEVYGKPDRILQTVLQKLLTWPRVRSDCGYKEFSPLALLAQEYIRNVLHYRPERAHDPEPIITSIRRKLPGPLATKWEEQSATLPDREKLGELDRFLTREAGLLRTIHLDHLEDQEYLGVKAKGGGVPRASAYSLTADPEAVAAPAVAKPAERGCCFCKQGHPSSQCRAEVDPTERKVRALRAAVCLQCLNPGHGPKTCPDSPCSSCGKAHHSLLHGAAYVVLGSRKKVSKA